MSTNDAYALQHSDLNRFLYADVGVEASGMTLSVLSILARVGLDPWQEAGRLARLPRATAVDGLAGIIATQPSSHWSQTDADAIASRLVSLLPGRGEAVPVTPVRRSGPAAGRPVAGQPVAARLASLAALGPEVFRVLRGRGWLSVVVLSVLLAGLMAGLVVERTAPARDAGHAHLTHL